MTTLPVDPAIADQFALDGVVYLPQALDRPTLAEAERCFEWSRSNSTPSACRFYQEQGHAFYQDLCHPRAALVYRQLLSDTAIPDLISALWKAPDVWFLYEQIFVKEGDIGCRRTPWHQDTPYLCVDGRQLAVMWINFAPVAADETLEFVSGSHRRTLYDGSAFDAVDDTQPIYGSGLPRLPDIESEREQWPIVSWAIEPGDVVVFHPATLHGGAATNPGHWRRTLSLRFFGADATYATRPMPAPAPLVAGLHETLEPGQPFRHAAFPKLRPEPQGFDTIPGVSGHDMSLKNQIQERTQ